MNKRLLILADPYSRPSFAPRLRFLCDYLTAHDWQIEVFTEKFHTIPFAHSYPIHEIVFYRSKADWAVKALWSLLTNWKDRYFTRQVKRAIQGKTYDAIFCTTFSTFPLGTADSLANTLGLPLYVDIRDLDEQVPGAQYQQHRGWWTRPFRSWYKQVNIARRNRAIKAATAVTTVSPWHVDCLRPLNSNVHLIYNGYDSDKFFPEDIPTDVFRVSYIGRIYEFQDIRPVEEAIRRIGNPQIVLNLHTPDHQPLGIDQVPDEIRRSSIMVVLTSKTAKGMMTTKFFEALGSEKPVLCVPDDEGSLAEVIRQTNAGITADTVDEIEAFILNKYAEWQAQGYTRQAVDLQAKAAFSRLEQSKQMEELLCC